MHTTEKTIVLRAALVRDATADNGRPAERRRWRGDWCAFRVCVCGFTGTRYQTAYMYDGLTIITLSN